MFIPSLVSRPELLKQDTVLDGPAEAALSVDRAFEDIGVGVIGLVTKADSSLSNRTFLVGGGPASCAHVQ